MVRIYICLVNVFLLGQIGCQSFQHETPEHRLQDKSWRLFEVYNNDKEISQCGQLVQFRFGSNGVCYYTARHKNSGFRTDTGSWHYNPHTQKLLLDVPVFAVKQQFVVRELSHYRLALSHKKPESGEIINVFKAY